MHEGWTTARIGDIAETRLGKTLPRGEGRTVGGQPYLRNANVQWGRLVVEDLNTMVFSPSEQEQLSLLKGDVLVCEGGEVGRCALVQADMPGVFFQNAIHRVRANSAVAPPYIAYALENLVKQGGLAGVSSQMTIAHLNQSKLRNLEIGLPPIAEQRRIVDVLGAVDDVLGATSEAETQARELYGQLLASYAGLTPTNRELGEVLSQSKATVSVDKEAKYRVVGLERSGQGFIDRGVIMGKETGYAKLTQIGHEQLVYRKLTAWEGPISVSDQGVAGAFVSGEFPVFDINSDILLPGLLRHVCRCPGFWDKMAALLTGSVLRRKRLNPDQLFQIQIPMPSYEVQSDWLGMLDAAWEALEASRGRAASLRHLRSELLSALLSGAHRIPETYDDLLGADLMNATGA